MSLVDVSVNRRPDGNFHINATEFFLHFTTENDLRKEAYEEELYINN